MLKPKKPRDVWDEPERPALMRALKALIEQLKNPDQWLLDQPVPPLKM